MTRTGAIGRSAAAALTACALLAPPAEANVLGLGLKITVPASARTQSTASTATSTPAPNGAQPGTVAPGASSIPTTTSPPAATTGATGGTGGTGTTGTTGVAPAASAPGLPATLGTVNRPPPSRRSSKKGLTGLALVLAAIGALLVLASLIWALARWLALQPRWAGSMMYSLREASYRSSATWAEFSDWARIGR